MNTPYSPSSALFASPAGILMSNVCHYIGGCQSDPSKPNTGQCTGCTCAKAVSSLQCSYQDTCPEGQYSPSASLIDSCAGNLLTPLNILFTPLNNLLTQRLPHRLLRREHVHGLRGRFILEWVLFERPQLPHLLPLPQRQGRPCRRL